MSKTVKVVLIKQSPTDKMGILTIRTIENRKARKKSLGITISESDYKKYFDAQKQRFKTDKRFTQHETLNAIIARQLKEIAKYDNSLEIIPTKDKSIITFWEDYTSKIINHGTRIKHQVVISKMKKYLLARQKNDLKFSEVTSYVVEDILDYITSSNDPKKLSASTVQHYLKIFKSVLKKAIKLDYYYYLKDPFSTISFKTIKRNKPVLSEEDVFKLIQTELTGSDLKLCRNMFVFQIFANGMRVSDILLLQWKNIENGRLKYQMFKTGHSMSIPISFKMALTITQVRPDDFIPFEEFQKNTTSDFSNDIETPQIDLNKQERMIEAEFMNSTLQRVDDLRKVHGQAFIFPRLKEPDFQLSSSALSKKNISEYQYKLLKHNTIVYNRQLKKIQKICGIETPLTSHVARHSFTNLLLSLENVNIYDLSQSLGHSSVKITEAYIKSGFKLDKIDYLNNQISDIFKSSPSN